VAVDLVNDLRQDGFTVVPRAVPPERCAAVVDAIGSVCGVRLDDPQTWDRISARCDQVPVWNHPSQWAIRQLPLLHDVWSTIWGRDDLWSDLNSCRVTPPSGPGRADPLPIHFDVDPREPNEQWFPGVVALTDAPAGHGRFRCVPSLFRDPTRWPATWTDTPHGTEYQPPYEDDEVIEVPLQVGDLLILDSHLPHGTVPNEAATPRAVFYVQLHPAGTDDERRERLREQESGRCPAWWRWKPGHDGIDRYDLDDLGLTALGRRLLGVDPW